MTVRMRFGSFSIGSILVLGILAADLGMWTLTGCGSSGSSDTSSGSDGGESGGDSGAGLAPTPDGSVVTMSGADGGGGGPGDAAPADASSDAGATTDAPYDGATVEAGVLAPCPTTGTGAFVVSGTSCFNYTAVDVGEPHDGVNATAENYAIRPGTGAAAPSKLALMLVGSGGVPVDMIHTDPTKNVFGAAVSDGDAVIGLAYSNATEVGVLCGNNDACYFPTRESVILGVTEPGSALTVSTGEGIVDRLARSLRYLDASDPSGGWGAFLTTLDPSADPTTAIAWTKMIATGHSQGGGHAAAIGKLFPVAKVVQLSSVCDAANNMPASWTSGTSGTWASDPTQFWGLAAPTIFSDGGISGGDKICPFHAADWRNLGMIASHQDDDAAVCGNTGDTHGDSLSCVDNYPAWLSLYQ
jgi:hypothetical protein